MYKVVNNNRFLWTRIIGALVATAIALFLGASFLSYNPSDSSWFFVSSNPLPISNSCGNWGAQCAALFFYLFGGSAFLIMLPLLYYAYLCARGLQMRVHWERVVAAIVMVFLIAAYLATYKIDFQLSPYPGGKIGLLLSAWLVRLCDPLGSILFLQMSLLASAVIFLRFSYIGLVQKGIQIFNYCVVLAQHYKVVNRCAHIIYVVLYSVCVRPPLFLFYFIQSLLDGSAFDHTGLIIPDDPSIHCLGQHSGQLEGQESDSHPLVLSAIEDGVSNDSDVGSLLKEINIEAINSYTGSVKDKQELHIAPDDEDKIAQEKSYALPAMDIFIYEKNVRDDDGLEAELASRAHILQDKLKRFGVSGEVVAIKRGPVVTLFEYQPDVDTKLSKILALEDDLAMALQAMSIRILAPIPGRAVVGFEVANAKRNDVLFSQVVATSLYKNFSGALPLVLGKGTIGETVVVDLARMPHLLIAGSTGSGKSVALNALLISLLCKLDPDELKLILIDPKRLEFAAFTDIAHLLFPIVTSPNHAAPVLKWVVMEMERRYEKMAEKGARNSADYNASLSYENKSERLPSVVVVIDELADLMITAGRDIEDLITRITQMARAAGIHMIVATQRPSVDVITGLIKANFPSRISFRVASRIDSRTILDTMGADRLLGRGDMLFLDASTSQLRRVHGAYVSDQEIEHIVNHIRAQRKVEYLDIHKEMNTQGQSGLLAEDPLYEEIRLFLDEIDEISISLVQRKFRIGYNRSARIIDALESQGLIMPQDGGKMRKVIR